MHQQSQAKTDQQLIARGKQISDASVQAKQPTAETTVPALNSTQPLWLLFASRSLSDRGLDELLEAAAQTPNATVVLRGIPEGMTLGEGLKWIQCLAAKKKPIPYVILDPQLFRTYQITTVPTLILLKPSTAVNAPQPGQQLARVQGIYDPHWLHQQVASGSKGDFGVRGPVEAIQEPDLITVMQSRVMAIDWEQKKQAALSRFWQQPRFYELAAAPKKRHRTLDPTVIVTETIKIPSGRVIAAKGSRINPLKLRPFTQALVVFDPLKPNQQQLIRQALPAIRQASKVQSITYIATRFDREAGWDGYQKITEQLQAPVYLLTPDILERFELQYTPSIVTAEDQQFVIQELADAP